MDDEQLESILSIVLRKKMELEIEKAVNSIDADFVQSLISAVLNHILKSLPKNLPPGEEIGQRLLNAGPGTSVVKQTTDLVTTSPEFAGNIDDLLRMVMNQFLDSLPKQLGPKAVELFPKPEIIEAEFVLEPENKSLVNYVQGELGLGYGGGKPPPPPPVSPKADRDDDAEPIIQGTSRDIFNEALLEIIRDFQKFIGQLNATFMSMTNSVRELQQALGIFAGEAAELLAKNVVESIGSISRAVFTLGSEAAALPKVIKEAQVAIREEFGGVFSSVDARELAQQAIDLGVSVQDLAAARRVFMTQTLGDITAANLQQARVLAEFEQRGLTARDAMEAISRYSEITARMGTRFQQSFAQAAADAKKIGVDLNKVNQVGDSIIGNFEGFLESMAELGAMGFGLDATRLAEIAETGNTGELFNELRSQLASTGKDITNLRRSEQLALSEAFGIPFEELLRLAGETPELTIDRERNNLLTRVVNILEGVGLYLSGVTKVLSGTTNLLLLGIYKNTLKDSLGGLFPKVGGIRGLVGGTIGLGVGIGGGTASGTAMGASAGEALAGSGIGSLIGGAIGAYFGGPLGFAIGSGLGGLAGGSIAGMVAGDDVVSRPGYGERVLVTPTGPIALNNQDNVVAYADDMISREAEGVTMLSKGALTSEAPPPVNNINVDLSKLEAKLDNVVRAIGSMKVTMNGQSVGSVLVQNERRAATSGIYKAQRVTD